MFFFLVVFFIKVVCFSYTTVIHGHVPCSQCLNVHDIRLTEIAGTDSKVLGSTENFPPSPHLQQHVSLTIHIIDHPAYLPVLIIFLSKSF